jgi:hypothetical protein
MVQPVRMIAVAASAVAVVVSGCAGGSGREAAPTTQAGTRLTAEQRATLAKAQRESRDPQLAAKLRRYQQRYEQAATECMQRAGFRYVPPPPIPGANRPDGNPPWDPRRYGFGISTLIDTQAQAARSAATAPAAPVAPSQRAAHNRAAADCFRRAQDQLGLPPGTAVVNVDLTAIDDEARRQADADLRVVRMTKLWAACMRSAGVAATDRSQLLAEIGQRAKPFKAAYRAAAEAPGGDTVRLVDILSPQQRQDLAILQRFEVRAAAADRRCDHGLKDLTFTVFQEKLDALIGTGGG